MKTTLIYNPVAGAVRRNPETLERSIEILRRHGHDVRMHPTTGPKTAGSIARRAIEHGAELIVVAGGDGTINETASGMIGSPVPLAPLPAGTANVLCMEMGLGVRMDLVAKRLATCKPERISVGLLKTETAQRHFLLMAGIGLDALIVSRLNLKLKTRAGKLAYWVAGAGIINRPLEEFNVVVEGKEHRCSFALASRVRNYGGDMEIAAGASLRNREFELVLFEGSRSIHYAKHLSALMLRRTGRLKGVTVYPARNIEATSSGDETVHVQVDGELVGQLPARLEIVDDALTLMMPPAYR